MDDTKGLVRIAEAAAACCFEVGMTGPYSARNIEVMADTLAHLCTLYVLSGGRETPLARDDVRGARFADGGKRMVFNDGRRALEEIYVTRTALRAALETIQRARTGGLS